MAVQAATLGRAQARSGPAPYSSAKLFLFSSIFWLALADTVGLIASYQFVNPQWAESVPFLSFGRLRVVHTNGVLFMWLSMAQVGAVCFYMIPRLCGTELWSERLGVWTGWLWNLAGVLMVVTFLTGNSQAREYAEMVWPLDVAVELVLLLVGLNVLMTVAKRKERKLYVTIWYAMGAVIWMPLVYFIGNAMWETGNFWNLSGAIKGVDDATLNWFYGHNVLGLWFTTMGVATVYYLVPVLTRTPLYGYALSMIGFWALAFFYTAMGQHHLLQTPTPSWLKTIATMASLGQFIPVLAFLTNIYMTMRGNWGKIYESVPLKFAIAGTVFYFVTCVQGPFQALQTFNQLIHYTQWIVGHAHLALFGSMSYWQFAAILYIIPVIYKRRLYSQGLAEAQFWLATAGFLMMMISLQVAGLIQGAAWQRGVDIREILPQLRPYWVMRSVGGAMMVFSGFVMAWNIWKTVTVGEPLEPATRDLAADLFREEVEAPVAQPAAVGGQ